MQHLIPEPGRDQDEARTSTQDHTRSPTHLLIEESGHKPATVGVDNGAQNNPVFEKNSLSNNTETINV